MRKILLLLVVGLCLGGILPKAQGAEQQSVVVEKWINECTGMEWLGTAYQDMLIQDLNSTGKISASNMGDGKNQALIQGKVKDNPQGIEVTVQVKEPKGEKVVGEFLAVGPKEQALAIEKDLAVKVATKLVSLNKADLAKITTKPIPSLEACKTYYTQYYPLAEVKREEKETQLLDDLFQDLAKNGMEYQLKPWEKIKFDNNKGDFKISYQFKVKGDYVQKFIQTLEPFSLERGYKYGFQIENSPLGAKRIQLSNAGQVKTILWRKKLQLTLLCKDEKGETLFQSTMRPLLAPPIQTFGKLFSNTEYITGEYLATGLPVETLDKINQIEIKLSPF